MSGVTVGQSRADDVSVLAADAARAEASAIANGKQSLFDLAQVDLRGRLYSKHDIEKWNPHRGDMALLDWIVWHSTDYRQGVGLKHNRMDEFWVAGHFPQRPMLPGVLMIEAAAQLAVFLYNARRTDPLTAAFTRIEGATFRAPVGPGDDLYLLCNEIKWSTRGFVCDVQGLVNGQKIAFESRIAGVNIGAQVAAARGK